jgi:pimeloyl-ACP methyl ester carboxylesterase
MIDMKPIMRPGFHVEIETPKRVHLNGLWFGEKGAERVIIWVHGLGSSLFGKTAIFDHLVTKDTAVLSFNNRGHDNVASATQGKKRILAGAAHEVFTDCIDDIEGAVRFAKGTGAKEIFLAGHSTGCQKSIYWAAKRGEGVTGIILLAPISDRSAEIHQHGTSKVERALRVARTLVKRGKKHELLPPGIWHGTFDAQRFLSLCSLESEEEIFPYWDKNRVPKTLRKVKLPILVLLAEKDEFNDRPAKKMMDWFATHVRNWKGIVIIKNVPHSFKGGEDWVARHIGIFMKEALE